MSLFNRHHHKYEIIGYSYAKDYQHPNCFDEAGVPYLVHEKDENSTSRVIWGQPVTVYTLQCKGENGCGNISYRQVDGFVKHFCGKEVK